MATVHDAAAYILENAGAMTTMKLEKLIYYAQAWSLVWDESPLFTEPIQAWVNGPVCPDLYASHRGMFDVAAWKRGDPASLTEEQRDTVNAILEFYGNKTSQWLSDLTHAERPWLDAREGLAPGERGQNEITHASMAEYYGSLRPNG
jgi:uncharacterized phage-associated protein